MTLLSASTQQQLVDDWHGAKAADYNQPATPEGDAVVRAHLVVDVLRVFYDQSKRRAPETEELYGLGQLVDLAEEQLLDAARRARPAPNRGPVQQVVDDALDLARAAHPGVEFVLMLDAKPAAELPRHSEVLRRRNAKGMWGTFKVHVYRDVAVESVDTPNPDRAVLSPHADVLDSGRTRGVPTYELDLATGGITPTPAVE